MNLQIKRILQEKGLTVRELASRLGLSDQYIGQIVNGRVGASVDKYETIANALGVKMWQLFADPSEYKLIDQTEEKPNEEIRSGDLFQTSPAQEMDKPDMILIERSTGKTLKYVLMKD